MVCDGAGADAAPRRNMVLRGRSRGTAASTSSQPQAVMDSSADTSAPRLLAACGSGSWVPASDLSADTSAARRLVGWKVGLRDGFRACVGGVGALRHLPPHNRRRSWIRRQMPPHPGSLRLAGWKVGFQHLICRRILPRPSSLWLTGGGPGFVILFYFLEWI